MLTVLCSSNNVVYAYASLDFEYVLGRGINVTSSSKTLGTNR